MRESDELLKKFLIRYASIWAVLMMTLLVAPALFLLKLLPILNAIVAALATIIGVGSTIKEFKLFREIDYLRRQGR